LTGQYEQALADFDKLLELDQANATAYFLRGIVHSQIAEREEASTDFEKALDLGLSPEQKQLAEKQLEELGR
jgi:Flp pilus assembly protein TadD